MPLRLAGRLTLKNIGAVVAILIAVPALALTTFTGFDKGIDHFDEVAANTSYILTARFEVIDVKIRTFKKMGKSIDHKDWALWCALGKQLKYWIACPPK